MESLIDFITKFLKYIVDGISVFITFIITFINFITNYLSVLPSEVLGVVLILFSASVFIVVWKAIKG